MNHNDLVNYLVKAGALRNPRLAASFRDIDRGDFVPPALLPMAYEDVPLPIGSGQTISQPWTVAFMLELLQPQEGNRVLDIGFGSGWTTALLAAAVGEKGTVFGLELVPEVFAFGSENLAKYGFTNIELQNRSGYEGREESAPYDRILVSAAASEVPLALMRQLKQGGRLVVPVAGKLTVVDRMESDEYGFQEFGGFVFVPFVKP